MTNKVLNSYDKYIVAFSGGKDSIACFLHLLESGVPIEKIELWHHGIDGGEEEETFMDWECTPAYCMAFAAYFKVPIYFSYKQGGFKREMLRNNTATAPTYFEVPIEGGLTVWKSAGGIGSTGTRLKFPQVSPNLNVRWCSAYLKIDVCAIAIRNQERFYGLKTLVISGERAEESAARAKYKELEPDKSDLRNSKRPRYVDRARIVKGWSEQRVWDIIKRWCIRVHPAYYLGWGRVSCKFCIFGSANQFASANYISPQQGEKIIGYENQFGCTIKRKETLRQLINRGKRYDTITEELISVATSYNYSLEIRIENWVLPAGAFGESCGPM